MAISLYIYTHQTLDPFLNRILQRKPAPKPYAICHDSSPAYSKPFWPWMVEAKYLYDWRYCDVSYEEAYAQRPPGTGYNESGFWMGDFIMPQPYKCRWECGQCDRFYDSEQEMRYVSSSNLEFERG